MEATSGNRSPGRLFSWIERVGNKVPNPFLLFVYLIVVLMVATAIISALDLAVKNPSNGEIVRVNNLLSVAGIQWILPNIIKNFSSFTPLGSILALVIGAGLAEKVGLLQSLMVKMASRVSRRYASYMVLFIAFFSHISSDAALVVMPPLGALIFLAVGRHPVAGLRSGACSGTTSSAIRAINSSAAIPAARRPRFSSGVSAASFSPLPCHFGSRGSTNLSVSSAPTIVSTITEVAIKNQLSMTLTCTVSLTALAASVLMPESSTSVVTISRLAVKPEATPAMAASRPATG